MRSAGRLIDPRILFPVLVPAILAAWPGPAARAAGEKEAWARFRYVKPKAPPAAAERASGRRSEPRPPALIPLPPVRQSTGWTCGAASLQSVLAYFGRIGSLREMQLARKAHTNARVGTLEKDLKRVAKECGLRVRRSGYRWSLRELKQHVAAGIPVIVGYQAWVKDPAHVDWRAEQGSGHYSVVIGVDEKNVWLMDPSADLGNRGYIPIREFMERWHWPKRSGKPGKRYGLALTSDAPPALTSFTSGVERVH